MKQSQSSGHQNQLNEALLKMMLVKNNMLGNSLSNQVSRHSPMPQIQQYNNLSPITIQDNQRQSPLIQQQFDNNSSNSNMMIRFGPLTSIKNQNSKELGQRSFNNNNFTEFQASNRNMNSHYNSQPLLFKQYNNVLQNQQNLSLNPLSQTNSIQNKNLNGGGRYFMPNQQVQQNHHINSIDHATNDKNRQMRFLQALGQEQSQKGNDTSNNQLIFPKHLDTRQVINDLRNQRKTLHSILQTTSEREILGLGKNGTQGSASNTSSIQENQLTFNQGSKYHQQFLDSNIFNDQMMFDIPDQNPSLFIQQQHQYHHIDKNGREQILNGLPNIESSMSNASIKRTSILKNKTGKEKQQNIYKTVQNNEELPLLTGFISDSGSVIRNINGLNTDGKGGRQEQYSNSRQRNTIQTSDPLQLQLLREVLHRKESPDPVTITQQKKTKNNIHFSSFQNDDFYRAQQLQTIAGLHQKQQPDNFFNGRNSQQQNVLLQLNNPLVQSMKTGFSSQASLINNPRAKNSQKIIFDGSRFNTDIETDFEGYMSASALPNMKTNLYINNQGSNIDSISNGRTLPNVYQMKNQAVLGGSQQMNYLSQQEIQMEIDKKNLLQQIDELIQKKRIARELENQEISKFPQKLQGFQKKSLSTPFSQSVLQNSTLNRKESQSIQYNYPTTFHHQSLQQSQPDYQQQLLGSSYPQYLIEQRELNGNFFDSNQQQFQKGSNGFMRNNFKGQAATGSLDQIYQLNDRSRQQITSDMYQQAQTSHHPQILLEDDQSDNNLTLYQQQAIQEQLLRNAHKHQQYLTLQNLPQANGSSQDEMRTMKVHQILGSATQKQRKQGLINEEISERDELSLEFEQNNQQLPHIYQLSQFRPNRKNIRNKQIVTEKQTIGDMNISPIDTEKRPSLIDPSSIEIPQSTIPLKSSPKAPSNQIDTHFMSIGEEKDGIRMSSNFQANINNYEQEKLQKKNKKRETFISTSTDDRDIRILEKEIKEVLQRSLENQKGFPNQIRIPTFDEKLSMHQNLKIMNIADQDQSSRAESSQVPIKVVITQDQGIQNQVSQDYLQSINDQNRDSQHLQRQELKQCLITDNIHNSSQAAMKYNLSNLNQKTIKSNQQEEEIKQIKEGKKLVQPKNSNSSTHLGLPDIKPLQEFKDQKHRSSEITTAKTYVQMISENEAKEINDIENLLRNFDGNDSTANRNVSKEIPPSQGLINKIVVANNKAIHLSKKSSMKMNNTKEENQSYESFSEKYNSSRQTSLKNNIIQKLHETTELRPQDDYTNNNDGRESIQIETSPQPRILDAASDATPLQRSPQSKMEIEIINESPVNPSMVQRGSISVVSNVMSLNIVREDLINLKPSSSLNKRNSFKIKNQGEERQSSEKIEITRMPYLNQSRRNSNSENQNRQKGGFITPKAIINNTQMVQETYQQRKLSNQQLFNHHDLVSQSPNFYQMQHKSMIILKNNVNGQDSSQVSDNAMAMQVPQPVTTITMLAPTIDAILEPIIQEIVNKDSSAPPQEKIFKKGRNARGKSMFAQNILFKLAKPRKQLDPEEVERIMLEREKEEKDLEMEELKAQSQAIPKPPTGKRRYVDYLIKQNEVTRPDSAIVIPPPSNPPPAPKLQSEVRTSISPNISKESSDEIKATTYASQFSFRPKGPQGLKSSKKFGQVSSDSIQDVQNNTKNLANNQYLNPITILEGQTNKITDQELQTKILIPPGASNRSPENKEQTKNQNPLSQQTAMPSSMKRDSKPITIQSLVKKQQTVKFLNAGSANNDHQEIAPSNHQQIIQKITLDQGNLESSLPFSTVALAKVPIVRQSYGGRPKLSEVKLSILPLIQSGIISQLHLHAQNSNAPINLPHEIIPPQQKKSDNSLSNFVSLPQKKDSEKKLQSFTPKIKESNSNLGQLGSLSKSSPNVMKLSSSILAPPQYKHSKIDVQIVQTVLESPTAINKKKQLRKISSTNALNFKSNKVMKNNSPDLTFSNQQSAQGQKDSKEISKATTPNLVNDLSPQQTKKSSPQVSRKGTSNQLLMPKTQSSNNFLQTQQQLSQEMNAHLHPEAQVQAKKPVNVMPKLSTNSISSIGRFMRGGPDRKVSGSHQFSVGQMHGKNF